MTSHGNDCYFFYYSTCTKGDSCPFRHCEAARGSETVCTLWQEGRCFRAVCKFRHMKITKNRKEIPCYWEKQPAGCQKPHCAFYHEMPRYVNGVLVQSDMGVKKEEEQQHEDPALPAAALPTTVNPQLRAVIKTETQEPVPSPTHPPVVINPADDDEDEDDQFSEEGEEGKGGPPPRKLLKSDDSLHFGVSTLEEIRLRKALKASMKRAGYPIQSAETSTNGEKENIHAVFQPALFDSRDGPKRARVSVTERLGRKFKNTDLRSADGPLKRSLAERLGGAMDVDQPSMPSQKALKPPKERLGRKIKNTDLRSADVPLKRSLAERLGGVMDVDQPSMPSQKALKPPKERLGWFCGPAAATQSAESSVKEQEKVPAQIHTKTLEKKAVMSQPEIQKNARGSPGEASSGIDASIRSVETFPESLRGKRKNHEEEEMPYPKIKRTWENAPGKSTEESDTVGHGPEVTNMGKIRVKTLEEIRREKAAKKEEAEKSRRSATEENIARKPRLLPNTKLAHQTGSITTEKSAEVTKKPQKPPVVPQASDYIKVKTFEEIMREKQIRKQEMEEQAKAGATEAEQAQNENASGTLKRKFPAKISFFSSPSSTTPAADYTQRAPVPLKSMAASPPNSVATPETAAAIVTVPSVSLKQNTADTKVRPKLNVKPSLKPAMQVKPGQRRRRAKQSAVAAVKPLNSPSALKEEPQQETPQRNRHVDAQLGSASSSSPTSEELQTVPVFKQSLGQESNPAIGDAAARESWIPPQSPVLKTPSQPTSRRTSIGASRVACTSAMNDFEELINEFTDDHIDGAVDLGIGEDDLLQELSEMIES